MKLVLLIFLFNSFPLCFFAQNGLSGKEFWLGFCENVSDSYSLTLNISSEENTVGTVSIPLQNWDTNFTVIAGVATIIIIPKQIGTSSEPGRNEKGIVIKSEREIEISAFNSSPHSTDGTFVLPIDKLRSDYIGLSFVELAPIKPTYLLIVATDDNTVIEVVPSVLTIDYKQAGLPFSIELNRGETYLVSSFKDISGTRVSSIQTCKPFAAFSGAMCSKVGFSDAGDHLFHQMMPISLLGQEFLIPEIINPFTIKILAIEDNTEAIIDNWTSIKLNAGEYYTMRQVSSSLYIKSSKPIEVAQFVNQLDRNGDPAMTFIPAIYHFMQITKIVITDFQEIKNHFINLIVKTSSINEVFLNGQNLTSPFKPFPAKPDYSYQVIELNPGIYEIFSQKGIQLSVFGLGIADSYFYSPTITDDIAKTANVFIIPDLIVSNDTTILLGTFTKLEAVTQFNNANYNWSPLIGLSCATCSNTIASPTETTTYCFTVTRSNGCSIKDSVTVSVDTDLHVYVPNIFSPNTDGQNDVLYVRGKGIKNMQFTVYNRWGEKVFETYDLNKGWDGTYRGQILSPSVFVYIVDAILESGQRVVKKGDVTLIK